MNVTRRVLVFVLPCLAMAAVLRPTAASPGDPPAGAAPAPAERPGEKKAKKKVDALILAKDLRRSVAFAAKSAHQAKDARLDPKSVHAQPFWTELRKMEKTVSGISAGLKAHDPKVFQAIGKGTETLAALRVAWHRTGAADANVKEGIETLSHAYNALRKDYGKEAIRRRQGGALSEREQQHFADIKDKEAKVAARWKYLRDKAALKGDKRVVEELDHLLGEAERIAKAEVTVDAYLHALVLVDAVEGEWAAYSYYVPADLRPSWHEAEVVTEATFAAWDVDYAEEVDSVAVEDWAYLAEDAEVSADVDLDVEISEEEVDASDSWLEESVHDTSVEEYYGETEHEEADDAGGDEDADGGGDEGD